MLTKTAFPLFVALFCCGTALAAADRPTTAPARGGEARAELVLVSDGAAKLEFGEERLACRAGRSRRCW